MRFTQDGVRGCQAPHSSPMRLQVPARPRRTAKVTWSYKPKDPCHETGTETSSTIARPNAVFAASDSTKPHVSNVGSIQTRPDKRRGGCRALFLCSSSFFLCCSPPPPSPRRGRTSGGQRGPRSRLPRLPPARDDRAGLWRRASGRRRPHQQSFERHAHRSLTLHLASSIRTVSSSWRRKAQSWWSLRPKALPTPPPSRPGII